LVLLKVRFIIVNAVKILSKDGREPNMKRSLSLIVVLVIATVFAVGLAACGGSGSSSDESTAVVQENTAPAVAATVAEAVPQADTASKADALVGTWKDVSDPSSTATITKSGNDYQYADKDGTYKCTFEGGKLKVQVSGDASDTAEAYIDTATGHLCVLYQGGLSEFQK
jgi:hypothetical protein